MSTFFFHTKISCPQLRRSLSLQFGSHLKNHPDEAREKQGETIYKGQAPAGHLIRELLRLLRALDSKKAKTVKDISSESGMGLRQTYRWLEALEAEKMVDKFDRSLARYRLKPVGTRLRQSGTTE